MTTLMKAPTRRSRKVRIGLVVSDRMMKTRVVRVNWLVRHPLYPRVIRRSEKFKVHDETNSARVGDWVKIMETRPLSKDKRWRVVDIIRRGSSAPPIPGEEPSAKNDQESRAAK